MSELPKLRVKMLQGHEESRDFEEAKTLLSDWGALVVVEGQVINSYEELVKLAGQNSCKNKEFLEVVLLPLIAGG